MPPGPQASKGSGRRKWIRFTMGTSVAKRRDRIDKRWTGAEFFSMSLLKQKFEVRAICAGTLKVFSIDGSMLKSLKIPSAGAYSLPAGKRVLHCAFFVE